MQIPRMEAAAAAQAQNLPLSTDHGTPGSGARSSAHTTLRERFPFCAPKVITLALPTSEKCHSHKG